MKSYKGKLGYMFRVEENMLPAFPIATIQGHEVMMMIVDRNRGRPKIPS